MEIVTKFSIHYSFVFGNAKISSFPIMIQAQTVEFPRTRMVTM